MTKQSKTSSFLESLLNVGSGFVLSLFVWVLFIKPVFDIDTTMGDNLLITLTFTVISVVRGYAWRRWFNSIEKGEVR